MIFTTPENFIDFDKFVCFALNPVFLTFTNYSEVLIRNINYFFQILKPTENNPVFLVLQEQEQGPLESKTVGSI